MKTKTTKLSLAEKLSRKLDREIAARNLKFKKASLPQQRVMIAQDALDRLKGGQFKPTHGKWALIPSLIRDIYKLDSYDRQDLLSSSLQSHIVKNKVKCQCCALGGLMTSCIAIRNDFTVEDYESDRINGAEAIQGEDSAGLAEYFTQTQLELIEFVFESGEGYTTSYAVDDCHDTTRLEKARAFIQKYPNTTTRFREIMKNIIANNGTFIP